MTEEQRSWKYTFFTLVESSDTARAILNYAKSKGYKKLAIMRLEREYGELGAKFLRKFASDYGVEVVAEERGADADRDFTAQLSKIRDANADFIVVWFANPGGSLLLKNAKQIGITIPMIAPPSMDSAATVKLAGDAAEGTDLGRTDRWRRTASPPGAVRQGLCRRRSQQARLRTRSKLRDMMRLKLWHLRCGGSNRPIRGRNCAIRCRPSITTARDLSCIIARRKNDPAADAIVLTQIKNGTFVLVR